MEQRKKRKKVERKLRAVRMSVYVGISFLIFEYIGVFAIAGPAGMYSISEHRSNAFYPKTFVDIEVTEPNGQNYVLDEDGYAKNDGNGKSVYVTNSGVNKKNVVLRARIVATIYDEDGVTAIARTQNFKLTGEALTNNMGDSGKWYHAGVLEQAFVHSAANGETYFYYTDVLTKGTNTTNLFDDVQLTDVSEVPDGGFVEFKVLIDTVEVDVEETAWASKFAKVTTAWGSVPAGLWK